jgi:hypothetical protein
MTTAVLMLQRRMILVTSAVWTLADQGQRSTVHLRSSFKCALLDLARFCGPQAANSLEAIQGATAAASYHPARWNACAEAIHGSVRLCVALQM